jgi:DNA-binding transcriptional regulator GbsR (MarR family)
MKGYLWTESLPGAVVSTGDRGHLRNWEAVAIDAVGNVIEFWGFKRNQGRVWALLYLRDVALTAAEIERELELSKGGVSMLLRDLERWGVILRVRTPGDAAWRYKAEVDLMQMARRVIEEREFAFIARIRADLSEAHKLAAAAPGTSKEQLQRLARMETVAEATETALKLFLSTSRLDVGSMFEVFRGA